MNAISGVGVFRRTVGLVFALAMLCIVRADAAPAAATAPPATQPAGASSPAEVLKDRGLLRMGFWLILPGETEVHGAVPQLRAAKGRIANDANAHRDAELDIKHSAERLDAMAAELKQLDAAIAQSDQAGKRLNPKNTLQYNEWVGENNELHGRRDSLGLDINRENRRLQSLQEHEPAVRDSRSAYVTLAVSLGGKAEAVAKSYENLAKDTQLAAAIAEINKTARPALRLGPSGLFAGDLAYVRQCFKEVDSDTVPVGKDPSGPKVQVVLNGKVTETMVWDSGASAVQISAATAKALGLKISSKDPEAEFTVADGRTIKAKIVMLDSIRLGAFTVKNVACSVLPPDVPGSDDLLGDTFQRHFVCRLDQQGGHLQLTPIDPAVVKGLPTDDDTATAKAPEGAPAGGKGPEAATPKAAPAASGLHGELIGTMTGDTSRTDKGAIVLQDDERIATAQHFKPPIRLTVVAQTDSTNLNLNYAADKIIFNWDKNKGNNIPDALPISGAS